MYLSPPLSSSSSSTYLSNKENSMNPSPLVRGSAPASSSAAGNESKPWVCSVCSKRFAMKRGLTVHVDTIHENSKRFECHLCARVFNQKGNLNNHIRVSHEGSKDYQCELCEWKFSAVALLDKHMISVHKVDPHFDCDTCGQIYDNRKLLRKHKVSLHKDSSGNRMHEVRKRFYCGYCNFGFSFKTFLDKHVASVHSKPSGFVCKVCDKAFENKTSLESHTATKHKQIHLQQQEKQTVAIPGQQILLTIPETSTTQILQTNLPAGGHPPGGNQQAALQHLQQPQLQQHQQQPQQQQIFYQQPYPSQGGTTVQDLQQQQRFFPGAETPVSQGGGGSIQPLQLHHFQYQPPLGTTAQPTLLYQPATTQQPHQIQIHLQPLTSLISSGSSPPPAHQGQATSHIPPGVPQPAHGTSNLIITPAAPEAAHPSTISSSALQSLRATPMQPQHPVQVMLQQQLTPAAEACDLCNLPCSDKQDLIKHKALFHNFKCEICEEKFPSFEALTAHKISHLTPCPVCEVRFKERPMLLTHFIEAHEGKELCNLCYEAVFDSKEALVAHLEEEHGPDSMGKCQEALNSVKNEVKEHKKFVSVVDELVVQLQKYKDKSSSSNQGQRKRKSKDHHHHHQNSGKAPHIDNGSSNAHFS